MYFHPDPAIFDPDTLGMDFKKNNRQIRFVRTHAGKNSYWSVAFLTYVICIQDIQFKYFRD